MPLTECMTRTTHRQYQVWMRWLSDEWNRPSRTDHYLMQLAAMQTKDRTLGEMQIKFERKEEQKPPMTPEEIAEEKRIRTLEAKSRHRTLRKQNLADHPKAQSKPPTRRPRRGK